MRRVIADDVFRDSVGRSAAPRLGSGEPLPDGQHGNAGALVDRTPAGDSSAAGPATLCSAFAACAGKGNDARASAPWSIDWPVALTRYAVAVLLLTSAILKAVSPAESAALAAGYSIPPWLTAAAVQLELLVAAALVFGCWQRWTLRLTIGLFSIFAAFSLYRAVAGYESCGCFGASR